jgi:hypothetical protein
MWRSLMETTFLSREIWSITAGDPRFIFCGHIIFSPTTRTGCSLGYTMASEVGTSLVWLAQLDYKI